VVYVTLFGSVARALEREVPRFREFRRARIELYHECKDVDLAVGVRELGDLRALQTARVEGLRRAGEQHITFAHHQVDIFLLDARTGEHLGRLCNFKRCPTDKVECRVPGCGRHRLLRRVEDFTWRADALSEGRAVRLYDEQTDPWTAIERVPDDPAAARV